MNGKDTVREMWLPRWPLQPKFIGLAFSISPTPRLVLFLGPCPVSPDLPYFYSWRAELFGGLGWVEVEVGGLGWRRFGVEEEGGSWNAITELATDICCSMDFQLFLPATIVNRKNNANYVSSIFCNQKYKDPLVCDFEYFLRHSYLGLSEKGFQTSDCVWYHCKGYVKSTTEANGQMGIIGNFMSLCYESPLTKSFICITNKLKMGKNNTCWQN